MADQSKPIDNHVLLKVYFPDGLRYGWFVRWTEARNGTQVPYVEDDTNVRRAHRFERGSAYAMRNNLRSKGLRAHIVDPRRMDVCLYENAAQQEDPRPSVERLPHHIGSVLIIPASLGRWAIRFPGMEIESVYGTTPEDAFEKVSRLAPNLLQYAERYEEPIPEPVPAPALAANALPDGQRFRTTS